MTIAFTANERPTMGVELELRLVDARTGDLVSASNEILAEMGKGHPDGLHPKAKHELFQSTIEIITAVCETAAQARADLSVTLDELCAQVDSGSTSTRPSSVWLSVSLSPPRLVLADHDVALLPSWVSGNLSGGSASDPSGPSGRQ